MALDSLNTLKKFGQLLSTLFIVASRLIPHTEIMIVRRESKKGQGLQAALGRTGSLELTFAIFLISYVLK